MCQEIRVSLKRVTIEKYIKTRIDYLETLTASSCNQIKCENYGRNKH